MRPIVKDRREDHTTDTSLEERAVIVICPRVNICPCDLLLAGVYLALRERDAVVLDGILRERIVKFEGAPGSQVISVAT